MDLKIGFEIIFFYSSASTPALCINIPSVSWKLSAVVMVVGHNKREFKMQLLNFGANPLTEDKAGFVMFYRSALFSPTLLVQLLGRNRGSSNA